MDEEFPQLEPKEHQKEFLADWYSPKKLFKGHRQSGKSTLLLCELRRFMRHGFSCALIAPQQEGLRRIKERYYSRFGERLTCYFSSYQEMEKGNLRGWNFDVVLMDEMQTTTFDKISEEIIPMNLSFIRATADRGKFSDFHYLNDEPGFFDAVYTD